MPDHFSPAILVMHAAYEAAFAGITTIERAESRFARGETDTDKRIQHHAGIRALSNEGHALSVAILHQVPDSRQEAIILQFHLWNMIDLVDSTEHCEREKEAVLVATDTIFDFMACEFPGIDHEGIGSSFAAGTMLARSRRRLRTADLEELA